jgi:hypothetical protein
MRRLWLMMVLLLAASLVSLKPHRAEQHRAPAEERKPRLQTNPGPEHGIVTIKEVASPIIIGLRSAGRGGEVRWLALGTKNASLFHIDPQRLRKYLE